MITVFERIELLKKAFIREYGERKFEKIDEKIHTSNKIKKILNLSQVKQVAPSKSDFIYATNEIPYFMFTGKDNLVLGAVLFFELWHNMYNKDYQLLGESDLNVLFTGITSQSHNPKLNV